MSHAVPDQLRQLLPLRASVQAEALLGHALGVVPDWVAACGQRAPRALLAQAPRPLHALLPQQRILRRVAASGLLPPLPGVLALVHADRHLGLGGKAGSH